MQVSSLPWSALDRELSPQVVDALLHRAQTEMARKSTHRIKSHSIVMYLQDNSAGRSVQDEVYFARMGMLNRVMQGFLCDAVEFLFGLERQSRLFA